MGDSAGVRAELVFNGTGSDIRSWLSRERLISAPWADVRDAPVQFFSVDGDNSQ